MSKASDKVRSNHEHHDGQLPARDVRGSDGGHDAAQTTDGHADLEHGAGLAADRRTIERRDGIDGGYPEQQPFPGLEGQVAYGEVTTGPFPPPLMLRGYQEIDASWPERIMQMAEKEQISTIENTSIRVRAEAMATRIGSVTPLILGIVGLLLVAYLSNNGKLAEVLGALLSVLLLYLIPLFVSKRPKYRQPLDQPGHETDQ